MTSHELKTVAEILADWIDPAPGIPAIYLFGSRVRGDHRPDSDVDVRLYLVEWSNECEATLQWWVTQNQTDFEDVKARLPGPLAIHRELEDAADRDIYQGRTNPVLMVRRVVCIWTPPKRGIEF